VSGKVNGLEGAVRLSDIAKRMMAVMGVMLLLLVAGSAVYYRSLDFLPFALGALLGVLLNIVKVILLDRTVSKVLDNEKMNAGNYVRFQHFFRFFLTGLVFLLAAFVPFINIFGTAAGVLTLQAALFFARRATNGPQSADASVDGVHRQEVS